MGVPKTLLADDVVLRSEGVIKADIVFPRGVWLPLTAVIIDVVVEVCIGGNGCSVGLECSQPAAGDAGGRSVQENTKGTLRRA